LLRKDEEMSALDKFIERGKIERTNRRERKRGKRVAKKELERKFFKQYVKFLFV
jgi:hypothetical protein